MAEVERRALTKTASYEAIPGEVGRVLLLYSVGLKVRDLYEVPAAEIILTAHKELEKLVGTIHQNNFKPALDNQWAFLVYAGLWFEPLLQDLNAYMDSVNRWVTGKVTLRLYKGRAAAVARESPYALYDPKLAGF